MAVSATVALNSFSEHQKLKKPSSDAVDDGLLLILISLNHPPLF
jgi:hypothetical protein